MVWKDNHPKDEIYDIAPIPQHLTIKYHETRNLSHSEIKEEIDSSFIELATMWKDTDIFRVSGAVAISAITNTFPRAHTNLDLVALAQRDAFHYMINEAKRNQLYLCIRPGDISKRGSYKLWPSSDYKHENIIPVENPDDLLDCERLDRNPMLCRADHRGKLIPELTPVARIRLWLVYPKNKFLHCKEDNLMFNPTQFNGPAIYHQVEKTEKTLYSMSEDYLRRLERRAGVKSKNPKHKIDFDRINTYILEQTKQPA